MRQIVGIEWYPVAFGEMPSEAGTYLVAFSDGSVESYPMDDRDINDGEIRCGNTTGQYWAHSPPHPDNM
jgi:hypothetical protein